MTSIATMIRHRAALLRELRSFFDQRGFLEVQPPCLSSDCVIDAYLDPISVESKRLRIGDIDLPAELFLQTSPESAMKRMLAAGAPSIYSIGPVFRGGERGRWHNPEFTMLEWYEIGADLARGVQLLGQLASSLLADGKGFDVIRYRDLFVQHLGIDPIDGSLADIAELAASIDPDLTKSIAGDRDALLDCLLSQRIQPALAIERPLIVSHYPLSQAALAKTADDDPQCAARFELFVRGVELANGYDELLNADELQARYERNAQLRRSAGRLPLPQQTSLLRAMRSGLPACAGVAMGVDRVLMVRHHCSCIEEVLPFPIEQA